MGHRSMVLARCSQASCTGWRCSWLSPQPPCLCHLQEVTHPLGKHRPKAAGLFGWALVNGLQTHPFQDGSGRGTAEHEQRRMEQWGGFLKPFWG